MSKPNPDFQEETLEPEFTEETNDVEETTEEASEYDIDHKKKKNECAASDDEEEEKEDTPSEKEDPKEEDKSDDKSDDKDDSKKDDDDPKKRTEHSLEVTPEEFAAMKEELEALRAYRLEQENAQKDALINKYFMLDENDKAEVIAHKEEYTLEQIEAQLALIYVKKNVDFSTIDGEVEVEETEDDPITSFSLDDNNVAGIVSPLVAKLRETKN